MSIYPWQHGATEPYSHATISIYPCIYIHGYPSNIHAIYPIPTSDSMAYWRPDFLIFKLPDDCSAIRIYGHMDVGPYGYMAICIYGFKDLTIGLH